MYFHLQTRQGVVTAKDFNKTKVIRRYNIIYLNKQMKHIHFSATCHWHQSSDSYLILSKETCLQNEQK
jgi:ribosomal protein S17